LTIALTVHGEEERVPPGAEVAYLGYIEPFNVYVVSAGSLKDKEIWVTPGFLAEDSLKPV